VWRSLILVLVSFACVKQAAQIANPAPEGGGTLSCREIMETCDSACTQPFCLHGCTNQGNAEAAEQHTALLDCGQRNGCTDEDCMRANCMGEFETCQGLAAGAESAEPTEPTEPTEEPTEPPPPSESPPSPGD
jgi:hypothetical protein